MSRNVIKRSSSYWLLLIIVLIDVVVLQAQPSSKHDLHFSRLATVWDEGIPLGNATLGALIWEKDGELRFSLDRSDLWDLRPLKGLQGPEFSYQWVYERVLSDRYKEVQDKLDQPYETEPAPSKIPGAAFQVKSKSWGPVTDVRLHLPTAVSTVIWKNGVKMETYIHATKPLGWFKFTNHPFPFAIDFKAPAYSSTVKTGGGSVEGDDLNRLGYKQGEVTKNGNTIIYNQEGWGGFTYQVAITYKKIDARTIEGVWSITSKYPASGNVSDASEIVTEQLKRSYQADLTTHLSWWQNFWSKSSLSIPAAKLEKQWYLELYKFGSAARADAPPISLQAVWTADNGRLPPWKGDFHHDLNTQLSYWPAYSSNHLEEAIGYLNHLDSNKQNYLRFTRKFFEVEGLNVPGVTTLDGREMGGWIQYSGSPTTSAWLAQHYYLQWRYSMDQDFLVNRAYPWISETAKFIEKITVKDAKGFRKLPISSSPEIFNNERRAWFTENTNYDLALMKFAIEKAHELALELNKKEEAKHWQNLLKEFSDFALSPNNELMFAASKPYDESHRHFSHIMAFHPLNLIKWEDGERSKSIIKNTIQLLDEVGPAWWCGYSYSWLANIKARAKDGDGAARALDIFANAFCLPNSFHVNGDQSVAGYSNFTYRPFTLEGNFAFASGLQEMLLQSHAGFIELFPAIPASWRDVSFNTFRTEGAFIVSGKRQNGIVTEVRIVSEKGGKAVLKLPFVNYDVADNKMVRDERKENVLHLQFEPGGQIVLKNRMAKK